MNQELPLSDGLKVPLVVNAGIGVNSTALLVEMARRGEEVPDFIMFADVGDERPSTYAYVHVLNEWLASVGFPQVTTVRYQVSNFKNWPEYHTLGENCLTNGTLPGIAFGPKSCSIKWKRTPIEKFLKQQPSIREILGIGGKFRQYIGYDAGPPDVRRRRVADTITDKLAMQEYPLQEWGWDRAECAKQIAKSGLLVPDKSSCTFCTAMKPYEVDTLPKRELRKIVAIEARFAPRSKQRVQGLWITPVKGMRGATPKPGRMTDYIRDKGLLDPAEVEFIWETIPKEITLWQEAHKQGTVVNNWDLFFLWLDHQCEQLQAHVP